ncbi:glycosyltransferase family 4 protein [Pseudoalteromonas sp. 2CM36K]|uniref:glycosyltransferase family 4 protein n=1 Tax=Pseudoalteromonas sp. 2CM36K TaxID=2929854 RepID=UPI0020BFFD44|nr:glycosyltransferase family 4 protein [Pseudoalteromonas sp. 2CM36K]MCK8104717.1 glycosyltransferase family 4 protein [Pseudoalteromonas sp. 2CM36K]
MEKLVIVTTVPTTLTSILAQQPSYLAKHFDVALISSPHAELKKVQSTEGVATYGVPMERGISPVKDLVSLFKMVKQLRVLKPTIVHSYTPKAGLITMLAGFICRIPVRVHTFTGLIFPTSTGIKQKILIWMDRLICACATTIVPEGNGVKKDLIDSAITRKPLKVIGSGNIAGVDTTFFDKQTVIDKQLHLSLLEQLNLSKHAFVFCFVGRFTQDKGFTELLSAFYELPESAHLLLVGEMDERLPLPTELTKNLSSHSRIHNIGWQNDVRPALAISNVLLLPSYREGFPNTPLQAGAMALPCIVTDINGCNEIIEPGLNGWVVPVKNSKALAGAMFKSMQADNLTQLGLQARSIIVEKFERQAHWQNMLRFYNKQLVNLAKT